MLRSRTYRYFLAFFFIFSLILSGCKTLDYVNEVDENQDTINIIDTIVLDTISDSIPKNPLPVDTVKIDSVLTQKNDTVAPDTIAKKDIAPKKEKTAPQKESFIDGIL